MFTLTILPESFESVAYLSLVHVGSCVDQTAHATLVHRVLVAERVIQSLVGRGSER